MTNHPNRSRREVMCQYGSCLDMVGDEGLSITLRTKGHHEEQKAVFCSAYHAALALLRLAQNRGEEIDWINIGSDVPRSWKSA